MLGFLTLAMSMPADGRGFGGRAERGRAHVPQPVLISPVLADVDITGQDSLEFKWSPHEGDIMLRRCYDFKLYKGREMLDGALILKKQVSPRDSSIKVESSLFQDGEVYTWSLRQIYETSDKSNRSYNSFKIKK